MKMDLELRNTLYMMTVVNAEYLESLKAYFPFQEVGPGQISFDGGPHELELADVDDLHELVSLVGTCTIRATEDGFHIVVGE